MAALQKVGPDVDGVMQKGMPAVCCVPFQGVRVGHSRSAAAGRPGEPGIVALAVERPRSAVSSKVEACRQKIHILPKEVFQQPRVALDVGCPAVGRVSQQLVADLPVFGSRTGDRRRHRQASIGRCRPEGDRPQPACRGLDILQHPGVAHEKRAPTVRCVAPLPKCGIFHR